MANADITLSSPTCFKLYLCRVVAPIAPSTQENAGGVFVQAMEKTMRCARVPNDWAFQAPRFLQPVLHQTSASILICVLFLLHLEVVAVADGNGPAGWFAQHGDVSVKQKHPRLKASVRITQPFHRQAAFSLRIATIKQVSTPLQNSPRRGKDRVIKPPRDAESVDSGEDDRWVPLCQQVIWLPARIGLHFWNSRSGYRRKKRPIRVRQAGECPRRICNLLQGESVYKR